MANDPFATWWQTTGQHLPAQDQREHAQQVWQAALDAQALQMQALQTEADCLGGALSAIEARAQVVLDHCGPNPWSKEYVLTIMREIRDMAAETLQLDREHYLRVVAEAKAERERDEGQEP